GHLARGAEVVPLRRDPEDRAAPRARPRGPRIESGTYAAFAGDLEHRGALDAPARKVRRARRPAPARGARVHPRKGALRRRCGHAGAIRACVCEAGKLGNSLAKALRPAGAEVTLRAARKGLPKSRVDADVVVLAVRDRDVTHPAQKIADPKLVSPKS